MTTENEQMVLDAFERGRALGFAEGLRQQQAEIEMAKKLYKDLYSKICAIENILQKYY
jgi:flagellar biosynthesis/type III secretory pathway protein FliH